MEMLTKFGDSYFQMCLTSTVVILIVLALRAFVKNHVPKKYLCLLWMAVFFRLLCPVTIEGPIPEFWGNNADTEQKRHGDVLFVSEEKNADVEKFVDVTESKGGALDRNDNAIKQEKETGIPAGEENASVNEIPNENIYTQNDTKTDNSNDAGVYLYCFLIVGTAIFVMMGVVRYLSMRKHLETAMKTGMSRQCGKRVVQVWECEEILSPMVFGMFKPGIYLPINFANKVDGLELEMILRHEEVHIARGDLLWKLISWLALVIHWWNPLVWVSVKLFEKDTEMACDEKVMAMQSEDLRKVYANALLHFSMKQSGIFQAVAFGESNTQQRVKNILKYRKRTLLFSAVAFIVAAGMIICLVTNPYDMQNSIKQIDVSPEVSDEYLAFDSMEEMEEYYRLEWEEWQRKENPEETGFSGIKQVFYYSISHNIESLHTEMDERFEVTVTYWLEESDTHIPIPCKTYLTCNEKGEKIYVYESRMEIFDKITTAEQARRMGHPIEANREAIAEAAFLSSGNWQSALYEPETALELIMHLEGGTASSQRVVSFDGDEEYYVTYTFADGSSVIYWVYEGSSRYDSTAMLFRENWFPGYLFEEEYGNEQMQRAALIEEYLTMVTAEELKEKSDSVRIGDGTFSYGFQLLDEVPGRDIAIYGLNGGDGVVIRDGDICYPLYFFWMHQYSYPEIYVADYDNDGEEEYAIGGCGGGGTGFYQNVCYILEKEGDELTMYQCGSGVYNEALNRIGWNWNEENQILSMMVDDQLVGLDVYLGKWLETNGGSFGECVFGDQINFEEKEGQWYISASGGLKREGDSPGQVNYEIHIEANAPVIYVDGQFSIGEFTLEVYRSSYYEE